MDFFHTKVNAYELKTFKEFVEAVPLNEKDVILTHKFLCDEYMKPLNLPCTYLFYEEYAQGEPNEDMVNLLLGKLSEMGAARIIGIGGGSVMDTAKLLSIDSVKEVLEIFETKRSSPGQGVILIPTTCGNGSEMDGFSAVYLNKFGCKIGKSTECCVADKSFLIEELFKKLSYDILYAHHGGTPFSTGSKSTYPLSNPFTNVFCAESVRLNTRNYKKNARSGPDERFKHLTDFIRASSYGGLGLSHNPCG
jgi:4-hydroxybutyrate dehydrogenase